MFEGIISLDKSFSLILKPFASPFFSALSATVYLAAGLVIVAALYFLVKHKRNKKLELISIGLAVLYILMEIIKRIVGRVRPDGLDSFSFPSRHAAIAFFIALALPVKPIHRALLIVWAMLVCLSRLVMQEHYLSDVVFGAGLGFVSLLAIKYINKGSKAD